METTSVPIKLTARQLSQDYIKLTKAARKDIGISSDTIKKLGDLSRSNGLFAVVATDVPDTDNKVFYIIKSEQAYNKFFATDRHGYECIDKRYPVRCFLDIEHYLASKEEGDRIGDVMLNKAIPMICDKLKEYAPIVDYERMCGSRNTDKGYKYSAHVVFNVWFECLELLETFIKDFVGEHPEFDGWIDLEPYNKNGMLRHLNQSKGIDTTATPLRHVQEFRGMVTRTPLDLSVQAGYATATVHVRSEKKTTTAAEKAAEKPKKELKALDNATACIAEMLSSLTPIYVENYKTWTTGMFIIRNELGEDGIEVFKAWSSMSDKYDEDEAIRKWETIDPEHDNPVKRGTLLSWVRECNKKAHDAIIKKYKLMDDEPVEAYKGFFDLDLSIFEKNKISVIQEDTVRNQNKLDKNLISDMMYNKDAFIILLSSALGTGKTSRFKEAIDEAIRRNKNARILIITPRQTFAFKMHGDMKENKIEFDLYIDHEKAELSKKQKLIIQTQSVPHLMRAKKYDLVIVDELSSVRVCCNSVSTNRTFGIDTCQRAFKRIFSTCDRLLLCDAFVTKSELSFVSSMLPQGKTIHYIDNIASPYAGKECYLYKSHADIEQAAYARIIENKDNDKKVYIWFARLKDLKKFQKRIEGDVLKMQEYNPFDTKQTGACFIAIHKETNADVKREVVTNANRHWSAPRVKVCLVTASVTVGIDVQSPLYEDVYMMYSTKVAASPIDCIQASLRCRAFERQHFVMMHDKKGDEVTIETVNEVHEYEEGLKREVIKAHTVEEEHDDTHKKVDMSAYDMMEEEYKEQMIDAAGDDEDEEVNRHYERLSADSYYTTYDEETIRNMATEVYNNLRYARKGYAILKAFLERMQYKLIDYKPTNEKLERVKLGTHHFNEAVASATILATKKHISVDEYLDSLTTEEVRTKYMTVDEARAISLAKFRQIVDIDETCEADRDNMYAVFSCNHTKAQFYSMLYHIRKFETAHVFDIVKRNADGKLEKVSHAPRIHDAINHMCELLGNLDNIQDTTKHISIADYNKAIKALMCAKTYKEYATVFGHEKYDSVACPTDKDARSLLNRIMRYCGNGAIAGYSETDKVIKNAKDKPHHYKMTVKTRYSFKEVDISNTEDRHVAVIMEDM